MIMPKRRRGKTQVLVPLFVVAIMTVPTATGFIAGATALPQFFTQTSSHKDDNKRSSGKDSGDSRTTAKDTAATTKQTKQSAPIQKQDTTRTVDSSTPQVSATKSSKSTGTSVVLAASTVTTETPAKADTAAASAQLATTQSDKTVEPVHYQTAKISMNERNELLHVSMLIAGASGLLYALSYAPVLWRLFYGEPVPARRTITQ